MSDFGGDLDPIIQKWTIVADEAAKKRMYEWVERTAREGAKRAYEAAQKETQKNNKREEAQFASHMRQMERRDRERLRRLAERQRAAARERLSQQEAEQRAVLLNIDHHLKSVRNLERQSHEQQLARQKAHEARMLELDRAESRESLENLRSTHRRAEALAKSNLRSQEAIVKSGLRQQEIVTQAHQDRITNRHKAMWSTVRTLTETGSRFMSSITQSALRSMGNAVGIGLRRITSIHRREQDDQQDIMRRGTNRQESILRDSMSDQTRIISREMIRQEGVVAASQRTMEVGAIGFFRRLGTIALAGGGIYAGFRLLQPGIEFNVLQQRARAALTTILHDGEAANRVMEQLVDFSKTSPFPLQNFVDATQKLAAFGFEVDQIVPTLSTIQDAVAAFGGGAEELDTIVDVFAKIKTNGKITGEELNRFGDVGVNALEILSEHFNMTAEDMRAAISAGAIDSQMAIEALTEGMDERFAGSAAAVKNTWIGAADRIKAAWRDIAATIVAPFISPTGGGLAIDWANQLADIMRIIQRFIDNLFNGSGVWKVIRDGLLGISVALGAILAYKGAEAVVQGLSIALKALSVGAAPWGLALVAISGLASVLYRNNRTFREFVDGFLERVVEFARRYAGPVIDAFRDVAESIGELAAMVIAGEWREAATFLSDFFTESWDNAVAWVEGGGIGELADRVRERITTAFQQVVDSPAANWLVDFGIEAWLRWQEWLDSGGVGRLWDALGGALESAMGRFKNFDWGSLVRPALIGLAGAVAFAFGGLPLLIGTALIALSPRLRGGITEVLSGAVGAVGAALPRLLFNALHDAAEFLSGPLLATIFGPVGVRIIAGIAAGVVAAGVAIGTGLIDGLKRSLPSVIDAVQGLVNDIISAVTDAMDSIPILGVLLREAFMPFEVVLRGIIPTLGVFVDLIKLIPTPILLAATAVYGLVKAWALLKVTTRAGSALTAITGMLDTMALRTMYAGDAVRNLGTRLTAATAPAITAGAASRMQIAMGTIGIAARKAGTAISNVGAAMPGIAMAAVIGLPIILGAWEKQKAAAKAHRAEVEANAASVFDLTSTFSDLAEETIKSNSAIRDGLNEAGVSVQEFTSALAESQESAQSMIATLSEGISTSDLINGDTALEFAFQMGEAADSALAMAEANDQLTQSEINRIAAVRAGEATTDTLIGIQVDVANRLNGVAEANDRQAESYRELRDRIDEVANSTSFFNDVLDRLTGNALPLTRVRENIEDAVAAFRELMNDPEASPSEQSRAFTDYAESIRTTADDLLNLNRPLREVLASYQLQRQELINQRIALGDSREEARRYAEEVLGLPPVSEMRAEFEDREATNKIARLKEKMVELASQRPTPQVRMDLERYRLQKVALDAQLEGLSNREIAVRVNLVATVDASFQRTIDNLIASSDPAQQQLGRDLQRTWMNRVPELAEGGIVTKPTLALIGEAGPEAVIPLSGNAAGSIPFTISFDASMIAAQVDAIVSIMAPMGERLVAATTPGMRMWANAVERVLGRILSGFETWGDRMVSLAVSISAAITAGITDGLREGRSEVVRITRGYARSLVGALNPLLTGIGETPIELNFAKGGIAEAHHGAQVHVFNEGRRGRGSSHGEAYIPFDPSNRARSRELAAETARRLGGNVQWFADGGITTPTIQSGQLVPGVTGDVVGLVAEFARRLSTWSLANGGGYHVGSGYRSIEEQTRLYQRYLAGVPGQAPAAPPGRSMHNFGLASDGNHWRNLRPEEFGLRFPMSYEPWHVEPAEGKALLGDTDFPSFQPLPRPPEAGKRGWLSQVAAKLMAYVYDKTLAYAGGLSYSGTAPTLGSASASPAILAAIRQAMGIVGVPSSWLGPLLTLISRESSFNPNAYNSILGASGLMQCVPLDSEILTRRGWLTHDEVRIGDETLGYNPESGRSEWTPITKIVHYENAPIVRIGNKRWGARVTPNHRWFSDTEVTRKPEHLTVCPECGYESNPRGVSTHRGRMHGVNGSATTEYVGEFVRTYDLSSHHRIRLAAQADTDGIPTLSLDEVRIIAWLQGDGTVRPALEGGFDGAIYQSKPQHVATLRALLSGVPHTESTRQRNPEYLPAVTFALRRSFVSDLWKRAEIEDIGPEAFVLSLSPEQRSAWLGAMIDAEGNRQIAGRQTKEHVRITQVDGELQDAITLAVYLEGYRPSFSAFTRYEDRHQPAGNVGMCAPHVVPSQFQEPVDLPPETVWCVKTDLETWTMRQDGQVMLTGNTIPSTFAAYALPGYGGIFNPVANVIAGLRYILARYGTIFNVGQATSPTPTRGYSYGGIVERDGLYRLAEGNRREAILPLDNPGRTNEILRRLGLADTFAMSSKADRGSVSRSRSERVAGDAAPMIGSVVGEMHVHSNAQDENAVATITANKIDKKLRLALSGV